MTPIVLDWFRTSFPFSCAIEIKATKNNTIPESAVQVHQRLALEASSSSDGLTHKISDASRIRQPFDAFQLKNVSAFVVACFTEHGKCLVIPIDDWKGARYDDQAPFVIPI